MRIRAVMGSGWEIDDGENVRTGCCRMDCRGAGCTEEECDAAYESSIGVREGIWIDCPRPRTKSEAIEALTRERDALLAACKAIAAGPAGEPQIELTGDYHTGLHCGLEDRCNDDQYEACDYGFAEGVERVTEWAQGVVADAIALAEKAKGEG